MVQKPEEYPYSSYPLYISGRTDNLVTKELILKLLRRNNGNKRKAYQFFVEAAIGRERDDLSRDIYGGMILGGSSFIKETLKKIKEKYRIKDAISNRKALKAIHEIEEVVEVV